jgi:hypothetical protein
MSQSHSAHAVGVFPRNTRKGSNAEVHAIEEIPDDDLFEIRSAGEWFKDLPAEDVESKQTQGIYGFPGREEYSDRMDEIWKQGVLDLDDPEAMLRNRESHILEYARIRAREGYLKTGKGSTATRRPRIRRFHRSPTSLQRKRRDDDTARVVGLATAVMRDE